MSVFDFTDYKDFVRSWVLEKPSKGRGQFQRFAKALSIHPTLVSHIFRGDKNLSLEQASTLCRYLELSSLETDFFLLLVQRAKSGSIDLSKILDRQITEIRKSSKNLVNRVSCEKELNAEEQSVFYSNWYYSGIRLLCSIPEYSTYEAIRDYFGLPSAVVREVLEFLIRTGLCKLEGGCYALGPALTHLESSSKFISRHHVNWRLKAIEKHPKLTGEDLVFSGPLTISKENSARVREKIVKLIQELGQITKNSRSEELRCFNVDWVGIDHIKGSN